MLKLRIKSDPIGEEDREISFKRLFTLAAESALPGARNLGVNLSRKSNNESL